MASPTLTRSGNPGSASANPFYSPLDDLQTSRSLRPSSASKTVTLRRLDGSPYEPATKGREIVVAEDMYDGQNPPEYKRQASYVNLKSVEPVVQLTHGIDCRACTPPQTERALDLATSRPRHDCNQCGKKKVSPLTIPSAQDVLTKPHPTLVEGITALSQPQSHRKTFTAPAGVTRKMCHRCGKAKRPPITALTQGPPSGSFAESSRSSTPLPRNHIASQHIMFGPDHPSGLRITCDVPPRKPVPDQLDQEMGATIDIDIIPPTATSERPPENELNGSNVEGSPLLGERQHSPRQQVYRSSSISSVSSSIGRSLSGSRRRKSNDHETLSPNRHTESENGAGRLINLLASAIRGNDSQEYARLEEAERGSEGPFSFVETAGGQDAYEMGEMNRSKSESANFWEQSHNLPTQSGPYGYNALPKRPENLRVRSVGMDGKYGAPVAAEGDSFLVDPAQQSGIARFKSLREGVTKASGVARSGSLKRLNSLKNAPQYWHRTDMAIEGASVAC